MLNDNDEIIMPDVFLPVAHEFGLSARIDSWVLEHTLIFMDKRRKKLPGMRLAINISPFSVSNSYFHQQEWLIFPEAMLRICPGYRPADEGDL